MGSYADRPRPHASAAYPQGTPETHSGPNGATPPPAPVQQGAPAASLAPTTRPKVVAVVLNYNGWRDAIECLASLTSATYPMHILVVDNGSTDDSPFHLAEVCNSLQNAELITNPTNDGIAGGNNLGIWHALAAGADYVLVLSNDTTVEPDFLDHLVSVAESDRRTGLVGAKICYYDEPNRIWSAGQWIHAWLVRAPFAVADELDDPQRHAGVRSTDMLMGCIMLIRRRVIEDVGSFDSDYFFQIEDVDFCYRVRRAGWRVKIAMDARIYHKIGRTIGTASPDRWYYGIRNRFLFASRRLPWWQRPTAYASVLTTLVVRVPLWAYQGRNDLSRASLQGLADFIRRRFGRRPS
jgi:GT2 family glycosyltransferase